MIAPAKKSQFLLLLRQPHDGPPPTPKEMQQIMARFAKWMEGLSAQGAVIATNGLKATGKILRGPRGKSVTDGPYPETKEIVGGYVLLSASSLKQALKFARACPGLDYRMAVEVRPVQQR
jgi:hypothetical protein